MRAVCGINSPASEPGVHRNWGVRTPCKAPSLRPWEAGRPGVSPGCDKYTELLEYPSGTKGIPPDIISSQELTTLHFLSGPRQGRLFIPSRTSRAYETPLTPCLSGVLGESIGKFTSPGSLSYSVARHSICLYELRAHGRPGSQRSSTTNRLPSESFGFVGAGYGHGAPMITKITNPPT